MPKQGIICWANGDTCHGCQCYWGKAPHCAYRPSSMIGRAAFWILGKCSFRNIFIDRAESVQIKTPDHSHQ